MDSLPTRKQAIIAVATAKVVPVFFNFQIISLNLKVLGHFAIDEVYLPDITSSHFGEENAKKVYQDFREDLLKVGLIMRRQDIAAFNVFEYPILQLCSVLGGEYHQREKREADSRRQDPAHSAVALKDPRRHINMIGLIALISCSSI